MPPGAWLPSGLAAYGLLLAAPGLATWEWTEWEDVLWEDQHDLSLQESRPIALDWDRPIVIIQEGCAQH